MHKDEESNSNIFDSMSDAESKHVPLQPMSVDKIDHKQKAAAHSAHAKIVKGAADLVEDESEPLQTEIVQATGKAASEQPLDQSADRSLTAQSASEPPAPATIDDPKEYPVAPFVLGKDEIEHVGLNSGNLALTFTDFVLPGKNGFDLKLTRRYNSSMSNISELTPKYVKMSQYTWWIDFKCRCRDLETNETITANYQIYDTTGSYRSKSEAEAAAEDAWEYWTEEEYYVGNIIEVWFEDIEEYHDCRITMVYGKTVTTSGKAVDTIVSDTRPNDHLQSTYGLGYGWSLGFPSVEVVGELYKKDRVRYYNYLHVGDGQVLRLENNQLKDYKLQDISFSGASGTIGGRQYHYLLTYKDGRKAYFNKESQNSIKLIAMTDRFNNTMSFNLTADGGTIVDTLGRTVALSKATVSGGHALTWTLPDASQIIYTIQNGRLTSVRDQVGRVTSFGYENYPDSPEIFRKGYVFKSYKSYEFGDEGVNIIYRPLTDITYPTGATSKYVYEFFDYYQGGTLQGTQGMLLIRQCKDYENTGAERNPRYYWYDTAWKTMDSDYDQRLYIKLAQVTAGSKVDEYDFAYQKPVSKQTTKVSGVTVRERSIPSYAYDQLPTKEIIKRFQNSKTLTSESTWSYDAKGNMLTETLPVQGTTTMTYDTTGDVNYSLLLSKSYKKDSDTEIQEVYTLRSSDKKVVEWKKVSEKIGTASPVLREAVQYQYDSSNNLVNERRYANLSLSTSADDQVIVYSYANTNINLDSAIYNNMFLTGKRNTGIRDVNGAALPDAVETYVLDAHGRILRKTDAANRTIRYEYDALGRVRKEIYPKNNPNDQSEPEYYKETRYLDVEATPKNQMLVIDESGNHKRYEYTSLGKIEREYALVPDTCLRYNVYDSMNRLWYEYAYGTEGTTTTIYSYDSFDRVLSKTTSGPNLPANYEEKYTYDDTFDPTNQYTKETKEIVGSGASSGAPSIISSVLKDVLGRTREETVGSSTTVYAYDFVGNKISQTDPRDNAVTAWWTYDYAGRIKSEKRLQDSGSVTAYTDYDPLGNKRTFADFRNKSTQYSYDVLGRLLEQKADFSGSEKAVTRYAYDVVGNVSSQKVLSVGGAYRETGYIYDSRYRVLDTIMNDGTVETRVRYEYDPTGNKTAMYTGMLGASTAGAAKTTYTYDRFGNMKTMTDPIGNSPNPSDAAKRTETYIYDNYGQLRQKKDRNGFVTTYKYDGLGRVIKETVVDSDGEQPDIYRAFSFYKNGLKATEENAELSVSLTYDNMGRLRLQTETCRQGAANTVVKDYGYDVGGNRTSFILEKDNAEQIFLTYVYDRQNRLREVWKGSAKITHYTYDPNGNRESLSYPQSGLSVGYVYNDANLVTDLYNKKDGAHRSSFHYSYFLDGNQSKKISKLSGNADKTTDYKYDLLGRLTEEKEQGGNKIEYAYDRFGNRSRMVLTDVNNKVVTTDYEYDLRNRLQTETKAYDGTEEILHYRYDYNGNQVHRQWEKFSPKKEPKTSGRVGFYSDKFKEDVTVLEMREYNGFNELVYVYRDGYETHYQFRPDGLRHKKLFADGTVLSHIWDGQNMIAEYAGNGNITARYLRGINLIARDQDNLLQYFLFNMHGDVIQRTDQNGTALKNYEFDAFGNEISPETLDVNPWRFCCEYFDKEADTLYLRARSYDSKNGRMLSEDPVNSLTLEMPNGQKLPDPLSLNRYAYCANNPVLFTDSSGNIFMLVTGAIGLVVGGIGGAIYSYAKHGEIRWQNVAAGAAIGGAVGLTGGAALAYVATGSAVASTGAVMTGLGVAGAGAAGGTSTVVAQQAIDKADDVAAAVSQSAPTFVNGQLFESAKLLTNGTKIEAMAETVISGKTLILKDLAIYSNIGDIPNQVGAAQFARWIREVQQLAISQGFDKLIIQGQRALNSTSANPGYIIDRIYDLTKMR